jgi:hypothetical protein
MVEKLRHQITGNAGLYHVARELSRRGWHVMPTVRNARGADLYAASESENVLAIQSKALSKRTTVPLGNSTDKLRSPWWIITLRAQTSSPTCFILTLEEVKQNALKVVNAAGTVSYWLPPKFYTQSHFEDKWERLGEPYDAPTMDTSPLTA